MFKSAEVTAGFQCLLAKQNTSLPVCAAKSSCSQVTTLKRELETKDLTNLNQFANHGGTYLGPLRESLPCLSPCLQVSELQQTSRLYLAECAVLTIWALKSVMHSAKGRSPAL